jgi:hypothetical protein
MTALNAWWTTNQHDDKLHPILFPSCPRAIAMPTLTVADLSPLLNGFTIDKGPPKTITVPNASALADFRDVTVTGNLLKKQLVHLDSGTGERTVRLAGNNGALKIEPNDGDLHFCLGTVQLTPHIACELQNARNFLSTFQNAVGTEISVSGFFRCLFEHPGFKTNDDAHIFEIHHFRNPPSSCGHA